MLSVYSRHYPPCPSNDLNYKRCRCPKWINGLLGSDGAFIRRSAKTRSWEKAEDFKRKLEEEYEAKQQGLEEASRPKPALGTVKEAVSRFLNSKRNENLADSTLDKLITIFEKQFLAWATSCGFAHITEITTADLEGFRDTWTDGPLAKKKKQERLIGFFYYYCGFLGRRSGFLRESDQRSCGLRSGIGAQRRWRVDCRRSDRNRQAKKRERSGGWLVVNNRCRCNLSRELRCWGEAGMECRGRGGV